MTKKNENPTTRNSIIELIKKEKANGSIETLNSLYGGFLRRQLRSYLKDDTEAIISEVLEQIWRYIDRFEIKEDGSKSFRPWLRKIVRSTVSSFNKRKKKEQAMQASEWLDSISDPNSDESREWDREYARYVIHAGLRKMRADGLESPQRIAIYIASKVEERAGPEVMESFGITRSNLDTTNHRVHKTLKEVVVGLDDFE